MVEERENKKRERKVKRLTVVVLCMMEGRLMLLDEVLKLVTLGILIYEKMLEEGAEEAVWDQDGDIELDVDLDAVYLEETLRIISTYDFNGTRMVVEFYGEEEDGEMNVEEEPDADTE